MPNQFARLLRVDRDGFQSICVGNSSIVVPKKSLLDSTAFDRLIPKIFSYYFEEWLIHEVLGRDSDMLDKNNVLENVYFHLPFK